MGFIKTGKSFRLKKLKKFGKFMKIQKEKNTSKKSIHNSLLSLKKTSVIERLPTEVLFEIFALLPVKNLINVVLLNKHTLHSLGTSPYLMKKILKQHIMEVPFQNDDLTKKEYTEAPCTVTILDKAILNYKFINKEILQQVEVDKICDLKLIEFDEENNLKEHLDISDFPKRFYLENISYDVLKSAEYLSQKTNLKFFTPETVLVNSWNNITQISPNKILDLILKCSKTRTFNHIYPFIWAIKNKDYKLSQRVLDHSEEAIYKDSAEEVWSTAKEEADHSLYDFLLQTEFKNSFMP